jgi:hypothetical protein
MTPPDSTNQRHQEDPHHREVFVVVGPPSEQCAVERVRARRDQIELGEVPRLFPPAKMHRLRQNRHIEQRVHTHVVTYVGNAH